MSADIRQPGLTWDADRLSQRRAVEAMRSGVPNAAAVIALGTGQSDVEDRFTALLERAAGEHGSSRAAFAPRCSSGRVR